jgi:hypothetical protein
MRLSDRGPARCGTNGLEVALVAAGDEHVRVVLPEDGHHAARHLRVAREVVRDEDEVRAELRRDEAWQRAAGVRHRPGGRRRRGDDAPAMPERTPNLRASYDAVVSTPPREPTCVPAQRRRRAGAFPSVGRTPNALPASSGLCSISTDA